MIRRAIVLAAASLALLGCGGAFRLRIDAPVGARLTVRGSEMRPEVVATIPFSAEFAPHGDREYPIWIDLPLDVARRFSATTSVRLYGNLYVYPTSELLRAGSTVRLPISEDRIRSLVTGESSEICSYIQDPTQSSASLNTSLSGCQSLGSGARIVLRMRPF